MVETAYEVRVFLSKLNKGDTFTIRSTKHVEVLAKYPDGSMKWRLNDKENKKLTYLKGSWYGNIGKQRGDWFNDYFGDIEDAIITDLINVNNPFHEPSIFSQHIKSLAH